MPTSNSDFLHDVFISYSHADQERVRDWFVPRLEGAGLRVCVDYKTFDIGVPSLTNMERAVEQSRKTVLVLTPGWTESDWANFESLLAQADDPVGRLRRMLPLMLKPCTPRKGISIYTYADFTKPERWEEESGRLVDAISDKYNLPPAIDVPRFTASYRVPFLLPQLDVPTFSGREEELKKLEDLLLKESGARVCGIVGLAGAGGIGKSALACHFAELHQDDFPDGVIGLRVDGKEVSALAREFARHCGEEIGPEDERDAGVIMQEVFGHRRALLIFDNADDANVTPLLPGGSTCAVIVTTRDRQLPHLLGIPEEDSIDLSPLPDADATTLLERLLGKERIAAEPEAVREILRLVGNLPLALQIVGATLQMQEWRALASYAAALREEKERLSKLQVRGASHLDVRASFSLSLKLLEEAEKDFLSCLSVCAQDGFSVRAAMAAVGFDEDAAHERLGYLYRLSLLNRPQSGAGRFVLHPLIRLFARELAAERSLLEEATQRHASYYIGLVKSSSDDGRDLTPVLASELDDIILAAEWLQQQEVADHEFLIDLQPFLQDHGHWQQAVDLMAGFLQLAERTADSFAEVQLRIQQAKFLSLRGEWARAETALAPVADVLEGIESERTRLRLEAMWLNTLGGIQQRLGQFDGAANTLQHSVEIEEQLNNPAGEAKALTSLGGVLQRQGRFDEASSAFRRSAAIEEQLGSERGQAMTLNSLGGVMQRQGHFDEAVVAFERSFELLTLLGDERGRAMVLTSLGGVFQRQGRFDQAEEVIRRSIEIEEQINNQRGQAMALNSLGGVLQRMGRFDEAADALRRSYDLSVEQKDRRGQAMALNSLGGVLERQGRVGQAVEAFRASIEIGESLGDRRHLAMVRTALGRALVSSGETERGIAELRKAFEIDEGLKNSRGIGFVAPTLIHALIGAGARDEALDYCERALAIASGNRSLLNLREELLAPPGGAGVREVIRGTVKRGLILHVRGYRYGFIRPDDESGDIYFRDAVVENRLIDAIREGLRVEAEVGPGHKGREAKSVRAIPQ